MRGKPKNKAATTGEIQTATATKNAGKSGGIKMFNQAKVVQLLTPAKFVALDIETGNAPAEAVENAVENWKAPKNWKPETVENKRAEMAEKKRDKAALLDASSILCIVRAARTK
jgi:hypothetical protein